MAKNGITLEELLASFCTKKLIEIILNKQVF